MRDTWRCVTLPTCTLSTLRPLVALFSMRRRQLTRRLIQARQWNSLEFRSFLEWMEIRLPPQKKSSRFDDSSTTPAM